MYETAGRGSVGACPVGPRGLWCGVSTDSDAIKDAIQQNATGPRKHSESEAGAATEQHSLQDQIAADKYLRGRDAAAGSKFPIRRATSTTPGPGEY